MKTIFEGTVNGEKFDNITAYNDRIKELINKGEAFNASTTSHVVDEEPEDHDVNLFPHGAVTMDKDGTINTSPDFIDKYNTLTNSALKDKLADLFVPIIDSLSNMTDDELDDYLGKLEGLGEWFEHIKTQNSEAAEAIETHLKDIDKEIGIWANNIKQAESHKAKLIKDLAYINKSTRTIHEWDAAYENVYQSIMDMITEDPDEDSTEDSNEDLPKSLASLWEQIFGE